MHLAAPHAQPVHSADKFEPSLRGLANCARREHQVTPGLSSVRRVTRDIMPILLVFPLVDAVLAARIAMRSGLLHLRCVGHVRWVRKVVLAEYNATAVLLEGTQIPLDPSLVRDVQREVISTGLVLKRRQHVRNAPKDTIQV
eukprot:gb/GEZJ01001088.1/.p2 GENE.gb/GEZJ01001088.1/~~gb/GEZJ01001088.1/.p2  ORF type:complete len:142 (-),score=6.47 gb/GEZJ01001088.1/:1345-1770(-)